MNRDTFTSHSPCIQCADNGHEYDKNNRFCQKCSYFILVSSLENIFKEKQDCEYCKFSPYGDDACAFCHFQIDVHKIIAKYTNDAFVHLNDESNTEDYFKDESKGEIENLKNSDEENINNFIESFLDGFVDGWLEDNDDWED